MEVYDTISISLYQRQIPVKYIVERHNIINLEIWLIKFEVYCKETIAFKVGDLIKSRFSKVYIKIYYFK